MSAVVDCGSPICILSNDVFNRIGLSDTLGRVGSKVVVAEGSQLNILGTVELDIAVDGIRAKELFYICDNLKQSTLLGMDFLRDNGCVVDFNNFSCRPWPADHVADMLEETENSPAPVIVGRTTRSDATTSVKEAQSECKKPPLL